MIYTGAPTRATDGAEAPREPKDQAGPAPIKTARPNQPARLPARPLTRHPLPDVLPVGDWVRSLSIDPNANFIQTVALRS